MKLDRRGAELPFQVPTARAEKNSVALQLTAVGCSSGPEPDSAGPLQPCPGLPDASWSPLATAASTDRRRVPR